MGPFAVGGVVIVPFPYADFSKFKRRPALVVGRSDFNNLTLCQITAKRDASTKAVALTDDEFATGNLSLKSYVRPDKLFTIETATMEKKMGALNVNKLEALALLIGDFLTYSLCL